MSDPPGPSSGAPAPLPRTPVVTGSSGAAASDRAGAGPGARVVIVGAGIAGLAAAYELTRRGVGSLVLDAGHRPGGVILTERIDGFLIDAGPDSLLAQKPAALDLCRELGLGERVMPTRPPRRAFILRRGRFHPLPEASVLGIPTRFMPLATTGLFTLAGKARMGLDLILPRRTTTGDPDDDESIGAFMRRRFGDEVVRYLAQPLLAGIHSGDVERLSMRALFPRLIDAEARHRSLILAFRRMQGSQAGSASDGIFRSLPGGIGELADCLVAALPAGTVRAGAPVRSIEATPGGYRLILDGHPPVAAHAVIVTTPAHAAARLFAAIDARLAARCAEVPYVSSATAALGYRRDQVAHPLAGSGFVVPKVEADVRLMAGSWVSSKWPGRAPEGYVLLRAFLGGARDPDLMSWEDGDLAALARTEMARLHGISGDPSLVRLYRWERANAQHEVGHLARMAEIDRRLVDHPGLFVTGSGFRGTGVTDCVADARIVAGRVADAIGARGSHRQSAASR
jgi:oxygen-dependent protoporphyrinogen oxidase